MREAKNLNSLNETKASKKLTQRDIAGILKIDTKTLYNWRKHKPELYAIVMLGFKFKELLQRQKDYAKELESLADEFSKD